MKTIYRFLICVALLSVVAFAQVPSRFPRTVTATIAAGGSLSAAVNLQGCTIARMSLPTLTSAAITFQTAEDGATFKEYVDFFNTAIQFPATTGNLNVEMNPATWYRVRFMKVRSGTAASAVVQAGGATITFTCQD